jgi:hypothetical protein
MVLTLAPNIFLIPISFILWLIANAERPKSPRQAIKIAMQAKVVNKVFCLSSAL